MPVTNVSQDQVQDSGGNLQEVYTLTFTLPDRPGSFTITVPASGDPVAAAAAAVAAHSSVIEGIYAI